MRQVTARFSIILVALAVLLFLVGESARAPQAGAQAGNPATVTGKVQLQGATQHGGVTIQLGALSMTSAQDGTFTLSNVAAGLYTLTARAPGYLMGRIAELRVAKGATVNVGTLLLLAGDVNNDAVVNEADFAAIIALFGPGSPLVDYNKDGTVDVRDMVLATRNRGRQELGGAAVDTASITGVVINQQDGSPLRDVSVTLQVDVDGDGSFAPVGQGVLVAGFERTFTETYRGQTDLQGTFSFGVPFQKDGVALGVYVELQKIGFNIFSQRFIFKGDTAISIPLGPTVTVADQNVSDGIQLVLSGSPAEVEVNVPAAAVPQGVTSVTGSIGYRNPRAARDLFPGNYRASDPALGEVQLESTVYAQVDLRDQNGRPILADPGSIPQGARIRLRVPPDQYTTLRDITPNTLEVNVPLYSFDYKAGVWRPSQTPGRLEKEDGTPITQDQLPTIWSGQSVGALYIAGQVTHLSNWNVDYPVATHSSVCGQIVDITGAPIRDAEIRSYGTTFMSNWTKPAHTGRDGTFCDDFKGSDEEEPDDEPERSPPAVRVEEAGMSGAKEFRVRVLVRYQGDNTVRTLKVKVTLTNQGETTPFATLEDQKTGVAKGPIRIDFPFDLQAKGVPRFREHVDVKAEAEAIETWSDPVETLTDKDERKGRILLPVVITHGITGDFAATSLGGYASVGPGLPEMAAALAADGYRQGGPYPTAHVLVYPSLHVAGIQWIASNSLSPLVSRITTQDTYADRVDIAAHSMGGLVSRYYIEGTGLNNGGKVRKLVMIGTPNQGAAGAHVGLEGEGVFTPNADTLMTLGELFGIYGATGETNIALQTTRQLLPDYGYYREAQGVFSTTWVPAAGYGYPTDPGMNLGSGSSSRLGPNTFLSSLNADGLDGRVDNFIIYRDNHNTITTLTRTEGVISWSTTNEMASGDATVPLRSAIMSDYPAASAQLKKCRINGGVHAEMMLDPAIRLMVRAILGLDEREEPPGCNPEGGALPEDRQAMVDALRAFIEATKAQSHPPQELSFSTISGMAGELRSLESGAPAVLTNMRTQLQDYIRNLSNADVAALVGALKRWGLDTSILWRHAPRLGKAVQTAAATTDAAAQRTALQKGVGDSFLHNQAQALIQMMLNAAAKAHSSEQGGQFASHVADLKALRGLLGQMATSRLATQTWPRIVPVVDQLAALTPGAPADAKVVQLENLLLALAGEEEYSAWAFPSGTGGIQGASPPQQSKGGGERGRVVVLWNGDVYEPQVSDIGVDWQDIGIPRLRTNSTGYVGTPAVSAERPARWVGTVMVPTTQRQIRGRVISTAGPAVPGAQVTRTVILRNTSWEQLVSAPATTGNDGRFTLTGPRGRDMHLTVFHPSVQPIRALPTVAAGDQDVDVGDILVTAYPTITRVSATPQRPERGATVDLSVEASHPLGLPLTYRWEMHTELWTWETVGTSARVQVKAPNTPRTIEFRVTVSDGFAQRQGYATITPANRSPRVLSLVADSTRVQAGREINFTVSATDADGDPLTYSWWSAPGGWLPYPPPTVATARWKAWSPEDRIYTITVQASDGALHDYASLQVTVLGRPDPTVTLGVAPSKGALPLAVTLTATAQDPVGQIVRYQWKIQKQHTFWPGYFYAVASESTTVGTLSRTFSEPGLYRAQVTAFNEIERSATSAWVQFLVQAAPTVSLGATPSNGLIPLAVAFTATASDADGQVVQYRWDFNGDGTVDQTTTTNTANYIYTAAGTFTAKVTVVDNDGLTTSATANVTARTPTPPTVSLAANPNSGITPLTVAFTATATDADGQVVQYRWDFNGDGTVDQTTTTNTASYIYTAAGTFTARVTVVDNDGLTASATATVTARTPVWPTVSLAANPTQGVAPLAVTFTATASDADGQVVQYRWDFNGDGTVDQTTTTNTASYIYTAAGTFTARVTVVDNDGLTASATATITVQAAAIGVSLAASPNRGSPPLNVQFTATALKPEQVVRYRWDFDGNGTVDQTTTGNTAAYTYTQTGSFLAWVEAEYQDSSKVSATATVFVFTAGFLNHPVLDAPLGTTLGVNPVAADAGDFNKDGKLDLAVVNRRSNDLMILLGKGDGTFQRPVSYAAGTSPSGLETADFNGDSITDIAAASSGTGQVLVFLGQTGGTFAQPVAYPVGPQPQALAAADFDGDGRLDLAVLNAGSSDLSILLGQGNGTFQSERRITGMSSPRLLDTGDFNKDGKPDLLVGGTYLTLLLGTGNAAALFETPRSITIPGGAYPLDLDMVDWDKDGNPDIVATLSAVETTSGRGSVIVFFGTGTGSITATSAVNSTLYPAPLLLDTGDFNKDGNLDVAFADLQVGSLFVLPGGGTRSSAFQLSAQRQYVADVRTPDLLSGDFTGDSALDLVGISSAGGISIEGPEGGMPGAAALYLNRGNGIFLGAVGSVKTDFSPNGLVEGNLGPSGRPDLVAAGSGPTGQAVMVLRWQQSGSQVAQTIPLPWALGSINQMVSGVLTTSGKKDVVVTTWGNNIIVLLARSDGLFQDPVTVSVGTQTFDPTIADFNGDGKNDLLLGTGSHEGGLILLLGNGNGTFQQPLTVLPTDFGVHHPAPGDVNGDGVLDLVVTAKAVTGRTGTVFVLLGNGNGTFQQPRAISGLPQVVYFDTLVDLNKDGKLDLIVLGMASPGDILVLLGDGQGNFGTPAVYPVGMAWWVAVADLNGDGVPDLVALVSGVNGVVVFLGLGNGTFAAPVSYLAGGDPSGIVATDLNSDGFPDVALATWARSEVIVLYRITP